MLTDLSVSPKMLNATKNFKIRTNNLVTIEWPNNTSRRYIQFKEGEYATFNNIYIYNFSLSLS